ncbi:LysR family transcriptional regulator [Kangiella sp. TOML190]|uniref:LysR family transcriptional regulator n=1 Tax=Kangiella sp. TOML190 TaxID=2931351 RepID=UPI00203D280B|nr:LysR family transcriptional regulator [Kangiella sp. TOML190]
MNVEHLKLFVRIATTHNISQAGKELGLSAAVSSSYINKLENEIGVKLLHRTTRKVSLTEEGLALLPHAEEVIASIDAAKAAVGSGSVLPRGTLRVAVSASFGRMHIIPALKGFLDKYPELKVDLSLSDRMVDMVEGGFDIAIRNAKLNDSSFVARKIANDKRVICASPEYLEKYGAPQRPEDLLDHHCINLSSIDTWSFEDPNGGQIKIKTKPILVVDNGESIRDACIKGVGITICSIWCAYEQWNKGELVQLLKDYPLVSEVDVWMLYPSSRLLAPKVRSFIDYMVEFFGETPYWESQVS